MIFIYSCFFGRSNSFLFFVIKYVYHKIGTEHFHIERGKSYGGNGIRRGGAEFIDLGKIIRVKMELLKRAE